MSTKKDWTPLCFDPLCEVHNQPKPTGEWPEGSPVTPWDMSSRDMLMHLSPHHNAALAAERWKREAAEQRAANYHRQLLDENEMTKQMPTAERGQGADIRRCADKDR